MLNPFLDENDHTPNRLRLTPDVIRDLADQVHASGRSLLLCGAREQPAQLMKQAEFERHIGARNICPSIQDALARAEELHRDVVVETAQVLVGTRR